MAALREPKASNPCEGAIQSLQSQIEAQSNYLQLQRFKLILLEECGAEGLRIMEATKSLAFLNSTWEQMQQALLPLNKAFEKLGKVVQDWEPCQEAARKMKETAQKLLLLLQNPSESPESSKETFCSYLQTMQAYSQEISKAAALSILDSGLFPKGPIPLAPRLCAPQQDPVQPPPGSVQLQQQVPPVCYPPVPIEQVSIPRWLDLTKALENPQEIIGDADLFFALFCKVVGENPKGVFSFVNLDEGHLMIDRLEYSIYRQVVELFRNLWEENQRANSYAFVILPTCDSGFAIALDPGEETELQILRPVNCYDRGTLNAFVFKDVLTIFGKIASVLDYEVTREMQGRRIKRPFEDQPIDMSIEVITVTKKEGENKSEECKRPI